MRGGAVAHCHATQRNAAAAARRIWLAEGVTAGPCSIPPLQIPLDFLWHAAIGLPQFRTGRSTVSSEPAISSPARVKASRGCREVRPLRVTTVVNWSRSRAPGLNHGPGRGRCRCGRLERVAIALQRGTRTRLVVLGKRCGLGQRPDVLAGSWRRAIAVVHLAVFVRPSLNLRLGSRCCQDDDCGGSCGPGRSAPHLAQ